MGNTDADAGPPSLSLTFRSSSAVMLLYGSSPSRPEK